MMHHALRRMHWKLFCEFSIEKIHLNRNCQFLDRCSHDRSFYFYAESLLSGGFEAVQCPNSLEYSLGICDNAETANMGNAAIDRRWDLFLSPSNFSTFFICICTKDGNCIVSANVHSKIDLAWIKRSHILKYWSLRSSIFHFRKSDLMNVEIVKVNL